MRPLPASLLLIAMLPVASVQATRPDVEPVPERLSPEQVRAIEAAFVELPPAPPGTGSADAVAGEDWASVLRFGESRLEQGDYASALIAFEQAGRGTDRMEEREAALAGLARTYRKSGDMVKAVAVYERLTADHPDSIQAPMYLLELGRTLRALGAPKTAIARFYSVLHAVLKVPAGQGENYRQIARTAQFEIAETHFQVGHFEEAARFFARLNLLDLAPVDRQRAEFKAAQSRAHTGDHEAAVAAFRRFIDRNPEAEANAEARFQLASLLQKMGRRSESMDVTLELLRRQQAVAGYDEERWAFWQRRTGNQLANEFYIQGDFSSAFTIYRRLAELGGEPRWRLPVLYQMGLCQERLLQGDAARELYRQIRTEADAVTPTPEVAEIARMAAWRLGQLEWSEVTARQLEALSLSTHATTAPLPAPSS